MSTDVPQVGVRIENVVKTYGDTVALAGLSLSARPGEILGIAGPNGAGKSTMVKVLAGETAPDSGTVTLNGEPWTAQTQAHRVAVVHQEPQLFPNLTVGENMLAGAETSHVLWPKGRASDRQVLAEVGLVPYINTPVGDLPLALQQRTEIARALSKNADVFLFDEPNSALTESESAELFNHMHSLASQGKVVLLVSHRLTELATNCDRVCVIVDGVVRTELAPPRLDEERIARELVVGRSGVASGARSAKGVSQEDLLNVADWTHRTAVFHDLNIAVRMNEIVAVVGVEGSGGRELVRSIAGFEPTTGTIGLGTRSGSDAQKAVAFVAGDRAHSLFDNLTVGENLYLRQAGHVTGRAGVLKRNAANAFAASAKKRYLVKAQSLGTPIRSLSGGNQQKVALASALALQPELVALEEPTRGVDLGSKAEIYRLLREYAEAGAAVVMYCTEDSEVFDAADRVLVISRGMIAGALSVLDYPDAEGLAEAIALLSGNDAVRPDHSTEKG